MKNLPEILFLGDIVGKTGLDSLAGIREICKSGSETFLVIANGENAACGAGLDSESSEAIFDAGVNVITLGNHAWSRKEILDTIHSEKRILRPANMEGNPPGTGYGVFRAGQNDICVITLLGRESTITVTGRDRIPASSCPFMAADRILERMKDKAGYFIVEIHGDSPMEKAALAHYLDGRVAAVVGTHTHVQSADETILRGNTAFITDLGFCGAAGHACGVQAAELISSFLSQQFVPLVAASGRLRLQGVKISLDGKGGASGIERVSLFPRR